MTDEQWTNLGAALGTVLRHSLTGVGGYATGKGWLTADVWQQIMGAVLLLAPAAWAAIRHLKGKPQ